MCLSETLGRQARRSVMTIHTRTMPHFIYNEELGQKCPAATVRRTASKGRLLAVAALLVLACSTAEGQAQSRIRVASYNIKFLEANLASSNPQRLTNLTHTIEALDSDVIALQEIADRAALQQLFPSSDWSIVIDDESGDDQDVAVVIRRPLEVVSPSDLEADDKDFLFPGATNNLLFPNRRDVLDVRVRHSHPEGAGEVQFHVLIAHAKSRFGGRATTDPRRVDAAVAVLHALEQHFDDELFILLGDFNDNPDDRSLNILETGDPLASFEMEEREGAFLVNLMEPLVAAGHVSHGRNSSDINNALGRVNTIDPASRQRNADHVGEDTNTGDILFDQILIPLRMKHMYVADSVRVLDNVYAIVGNASTRASDHLPVYAEFDFSLAPPGTPSLGPQPTGTARIVALQPNPDGEDAGNETVTLRNLTPQSIDVTGWRLRDRAGNDFMLSGSIPANADRVIVLNPNTMPLNNDGDEVALLDSARSEIHRVNYTAAHPTAGATITF